MEPFEDDQIKVTPVIFTAGCKGCGKFITDSIDEYLNDFITEHRSTCNGD